MLARLLGGAVVDVVCHHKPVFDRLSEAQPHRQSLSRIALHEWPVLFLKPKQSLSRTRVRKWSDNGQFLSSTLSRVCINAFIAI